MDINWYPGHMTGARRKMQEDIKLCDVVIELLDSRIPGSSKNPDIDELAKSKKRVIIMNKADLADARVNDAWKNYYEEKGFVVVMMDSRVRKQTQKVTEAVREVCKEKIERDYQLASGIAGDIETSDSVWTQVKARIPWLFIGIVGGIVPEQRRQ